MNEFPENLRLKLGERRTKGNFRTLPKGYPAHDFLSNDYLGLSRDKTLARKIDEKYQSLKPAYNGATGSRLLSGNHSFFEELEVELAGLFCAEETLLFNSGYNANLAILSSVPQKGDTIIYDEYAHVCLKEGARLSFAKRYAFRHNDLQDLEKKLRGAEGNIYVVVESIYSMDGDACPLPELVSLCNDYGAFLIVDEAHSTGVMGVNGNGMACALGLEREIFARIYTFGKGLGVHGACIAGAKELVDFLINFATPFIYTTALPLHSLVSISVAFDHLKKNIHFQDELKGKITLFKDTLQLFPEVLHQHDRVESNSAIQVLICHGNDTTKRLAGYLNGKGYNIKPILSPTVKEGKERIRICLHRYNPDVEIEELIKVIADYKG